MPGHDVIKRAQVSAIARKSFDMVIKEALSSFGII